ncbi:MAG TPA: hypothetical protein VG738_04670 [Chitinophagaceae bacterium]|nr:hypothetical protein [Chitinophagaceae bacterium]
MSINTSIKKIAGYAFAAAGFLTVLFFKGYKGDLISHPFLFGLGGVTLALFGVFLIVSSTFKQKLAEDGRIKEKIENLRRNGEKIIVDFSKCEIIENNYTQEREITGSIRTQGLNAIQDDRRNVVNADINTCQIIYNYNNLSLGKTEKFVSDSIPGDKVTLAIYLDKKKRANIYVDKKDRSIYFFDLSRYPVIPSLQ